MSFTRFLGGSRYGSIRDWRRSSLVEGEYELGNTVLGIPRIHKLKVRIIITAVYHTPLSDRQDLRGSKIYTVLSEPKPHSLNSNFWSYEIYQVLFTILLLRMYVLCDSLAQFQGNYMYFLSTCYLNLETPSC